MLVRRAHRLALQTSLRIVDVPTSTQSIVTQGPSAAYSSLLRRPVPFAALNPQSSISSSTAPTTTTSPSSSLPVISQPNRTFLTRLFRTAQDLTRKAVQPGESITRATTIRQQITDQFNPEVLDIQDVSGGCGQFFHVLVVSDAFEGKSQVARHRMVQTAIKSSIQGMHGITLRTLTGKQYRELQGQETGS